MSPHRRSEVTLLLLLGAPGAGKGTQGALLAAATGALHVSVGDLFRAQITAGTPLGRVAKRAIDTGSLVDDALTVAMIEERLASDDVGRRVILDGFPRSIPQAVALDAVAARHGWGLAPLLLDVDPATLTGRLTGRSSCPGCGTIYHHTYRPSRVTGRCDSCDCALIVRSDDEPAIVAARLTNQLGTLAGVVDHYRTGGRLSVVVGEGAVRDVADRMLLAGVAAFGIR
jgi:adenylate kinase